AAGQQHRVDVRLEVARVLLEDGEIDLAGVVLVLRRVGRGAGTGAEREQEGQGRAAEQHRHPLQTYWTDDPAGYLRPYSCSTAWRIFVPQAFPSPSSRSCSFSSRPRRTLSVSATA